MATPIAIVENDTPLREELVIYLQNNGFAVTALASAEQLYKHMIAETPKILILDTILPGEDGLSAAYYLRKYHKNIGIIFSSTLGGSENRIQGIEKGADAYLTKPTDMREYLHLINRILSRIELADNIEKIIKESKAAFLYNSIPAISKQPSNLEWPTTTITSTSSEENTYWALHMKMAKLSSPDGASICLTSREHELLSLLFKNGMCLVHKLDILKASQLGVHDWHRIENRLVRLRKKIKSELNTALPIRSIFGKGLVFAANCKIL